MKKIYLLVAAILLSTAGLMAQAPAKMTYQAVVRNASDILVSNSNIGMRISILQGSISGTDVYVETQTPTSNANGLVSIEIGGGTVVSGNLSSINWTDGPYFIKTETDPNGGTNYTITGTSQLLSVPYALYAETSGSSIPGPQGPAGAAGTNGNDGADGLSAYEIAVANGFIGTEAGWLISLQGTNGAAGANGNDGADGLSAYEIAVANGFIGTEAEWLTSLQGTNGAAGTNGNDGADGLSAYEIAVTNGFIGTEAEWLTSLQGLAGADGAAGQGVPTGGTTGQVLSKVDGTDYNTEWVTPASGGGANLQLFATSTDQQTRRPYAYNRQTFNFNNVVSGENGAAWTSNNTYTVPVGMGGLYTINLTLVETGYGLFPNPIPIFPEIQVTSGVNVRYYYGIGGVANVMLQGDDTDTPGIGAPGAPTSFVRGSGNFMIPLLEGDVIKVFYRSGGSSNCEGCTISFSTDGSTYLSIVKMD